MRFIWALVFSALAAPAQPYDLLLKGGHVMDPANNIDAVMDVAISGDKIAVVRAGIAASSARKVIDASGLYVLPGLVDLHIHVFGNEHALDPDDTALVTGATTVVDAGSSGWRTFEKFHDTVMLRSRTRVLALLNIVGWGMQGEESEQSDTSDMDSAKTAEMILKHRDRLVGVKTAHFGGQGW